MARALFRVGEVESGRVEAFSDGVLAIVITLLVRDLHVPRVEGYGAALWQALIAILPVVATWVVSYVFVLVFWVARHYSFNSLTKVDRGPLFADDLVYAVSDRACRPLSRGAARRFPSQSGDAPDAGELQPVALVCIVFRKADRSALAEAMPCGRQ